ncbi:plasminogen isoform X1 [Leptinotarsa decemlineata]|uniref:plasminogen isoform X1 n=1 Tax=Leptinotarsa decemlineata TaxID=7539 RepID=UPI003D30C9F2
MRMEVFHKSTQHHRTTTENPDMGDFFPSRSDTRSASTNQTLDYTDWSSWTRCTDCIQRRTKHCISRHCFGSTMYEERPCNKKRCKRKAKQKDKFHIVHLNESSSYLTKQAPSDIWSRWSQWSSCSSNCKTYRFRRCKKPGRCNKQTQKEEAYCYHDRSNCEEYVLNLMGNNNGSTDQRRYEYNNNDESTVRQPRRRGNGRKKCGMPNRRMKMLKIIGGTEAQRYKWPWHVAILNQYMEVFCGGTLIASRWVLTANHCIRRYLRVRLNAHDLRSHDGRDVEMTVSKMFPHPKFNFRTVDNDIALLMLPKAVRTPVACLPNKMPRTRELCSVMGWGKIHPMDVYGTNLLQEAKLPIVHPDTCRKSYRRFLISDNMLCAGWASGRADTCAGDSGGGLICPSRRYKRIVYSVQGITSFGDGCGRRNKYGIYTTVYNYVGWINYIISHY